MTPFAYRSGRHCPAFGGITLRQPNPARNNFFGHTNGLTNARKSETNTPTGRLGRARSEQPPGKPEDSHFRGSSHDCDLNQRYEI